MKLLDWNQMEVEAALFQKGIATDFPVQEKHSREAILNEALETAWKVI